MSRRVAGKSAGTESWASGSDPVQDLKEKHHMILTFFKKAVLLLDGGCLGLVWA